MSPQPSHSKGALLKVAKIVTNKEPFACSFTMTNAEDGQELRPGGERVYDGLKFHRVIPTS